MTPENNFADMSISTDYAENSLGTDVKKGLFHSVLGAGLFITGAAATEAHAAEPVKKSAIVEEIKNVQSALEAHENADTKLNEFLQRLDAANLPFDIETATERVLLSAEQRGHQSSIERAKKRVKYLEEKMEKLDKRMELQDRLEKVSYALRAKDFATRPELWTEFKQNATAAFARYEKVQTLKIEDPFRIALLEEMRAAIKEYKTPAGPTDADAIAPSLSAIARLQTALNTFDATFTAFVKLPADGALQFIAESGKQSEIFVIEGDKYDEYALGVAAMTKVQDAKQTAPGMQTWKLAIDPVFKGTVKIRKNGEWISKQFPPVLEAPAVQQPKQEKKEVKEPMEETSVEDGFIDESQLIKVDAPYYEEAEATQCRPLMKRYIAARVRHLKTIVADEDMYGTCPIYRAFAQAIEQEICQISGCSGYGHPDDFDQDQWLSIGVGSDECDDAIERMLLTLNRYDREKQKASFCKGTPAKLKGIAYAPANEAVTLSAIKQYKESMVRIFGVVPERFAKLDEAYAEVLKRVKAENHGDKRVVSITLNHWREAARKATFTAAPKKEEAVSALSSFFGDAVQKATAVTGFTKDMDPIELRKRLIELSATQEFEFDLTADSLEALIRIKAAIPELTGKDGSFLHGISAEGKSGEIAGMFAKKVEAATAKGQASIKLIEGMTGYEIAIMSDGAFQKSTIDWILEAVHSPVPLRGMPAGTHIFISRKDRKGF